MTRVTLSLVALFVFATSAASAQSWRYTGSLHTARRMFSTTLLHDGHVLVAGGLNAYDDPINSCESFDPHTELWSEIAPMHYPRHRHTATILDDGRVVVIGGNTGGSVVTPTIEIYNPNTGTWSLGGSLQIGRMNHTATLLKDGTILVTGGFNYASFLDACEIYDPATRTAHVVAPLKLHRMDHEAQLLANGDVLIAGGRIGGWDGEYLTESEVFDHATGTWRVIDPMFQSRISGFSLVRFSDGTVLAAGGRNAPESSGPGAEVLDPRTMTWQNVEPMKVPCVWQGGVEMPFDLYMITGGFYDAVWQTSYLVTATPTCEWYDKWHGRWYYAPRLNMQRAEHGALYLHDCGNPLLPRELILVVGGITGNSTITNTAEVLDITEPARQQYMISQSELATVGTATRDEMGDEIDVTDNTGGAPSVALTMKESGHARISIVGTDGRMMAALADANYEAGKYRLPINTASLPLGEYFVRLESPGARSVKRFIVTR